MNKNNQPTYRLTDAHLALAIWRQKSPANAWRIDVSKSVQDDEGDWSSTNELAEFSARDLLIRERLREHGMKWLELNTRPKANS